MKHFNHQGAEFVAMEDPLGVVPAPVIVPWTVFQEVVRHFDGMTSLLEIQARILRETTQLISMAELQALVEHLGRAMVLDGPTFAAFLDIYRREHVRQAALPGRSYASTERALRAQLAGFFADEDGAGPPGDDRVPTIATLRGIESPHIDFACGGPVYTWSYKRLVESSDADTFVILGVAHPYCRNRFARTRKDFQTPLGLVRTDRTYVDRIAALAGRDLFDDELAHRTEHSIEFQVAMSYVGPECGDPDRVDPPVLERIRAFDTMLLEHAAANDPAGWYGAAAGVGNRWGVCGLAAAYTMLNAMGPARGRVLKSGQAVDVHRTGCVSFASLTFESEYDSTRGNA